jgi:hypothetical protein
MSSRREFSLCLVRNTLVRAVTQTILKATWLATRIGLYQRNDYSGVCVQLEGMQESKCKEKSGVNCEIALCAVENLLLDNHSQSQSQSQSQSYLRLTVYRQSVRLGDKPLETQRPAIIFQLNNCFHSTYVASSLTRWWICSLQLLPVLASAVILISDSRGTRDHILLSQIRDSPNLEGQVPVFTSPRNRVAQLFSQILGFLFIASYDSQGYGGGIRPLLHTGLNSLWSLGQSH